MKGSGIWDWAGSCSFFCWHHPTLLSLLGKAGLGVTGVLFPYGNPFLDSPRLHSLLLWGAQWENVGTCLFWVFQNQKCASSEAQVAPRGGTCPQPGSDPAPLAPGGSPKPSLGARGGEGWLFPSTRSSLCWCLESALDLPSIPSLCLQLGLSRAAPWEGLSSPLGCQGPWRWQDTGILAG